MTFSSSPRKAIEAGKISPVVNRTANQQTDVLQSKHLFMWAAFNVIIVCLLLHEINFRRIQCWFGLESSLAFFALSTFATLFAISALVDFIQGVTISFSTKAVLLSPVQRRLMGIRSDPNFNCDSPTTSQVLVTDQQKPFNLSNLTRQTNTPTQNPFESRQSPSPSPSSSFHTTFASPCYHGNTSPYSQTFSEAYPLNKTSPLTQALDGSNFLDSSGGSPHLRNRRSPFMTSPLSSDEFMTDQKTLNNYLKGYFTAAQKNLQLCGYESPHATGTGYWAHDVMHLHEPVVDLAKNFYQLATRSLKSPSHSKNNKDDAARLAAVEYWMKAGVGTSCLMEWVARLRCWICLTIMRGFIKEVGKLNKTLKEVGCAEIQIGESSLNSLKQLQSSKGGRIPGLTWILPYLELSNHQKYLVKRIRTLASGGYMSDFRWDKGGCETRDWGDDLVTDCDLIMHMFCVYMDHHLPAHPQFTDGKAFSSQYFVKTPDKPKMTNPLESLECRLMIYQSCQHPPHYKIINKDTTIDLPPGRHNMFCAILLFLHHIKTKEYGMLSQVNLGLSGINILHVIELPIKSQSDETSVSQK